MITIEQAFALGFAHDAAGRRRAARAIYAQILAAIPEHPGALLRIAVGDAAEGRIEPAREMLERAIRSAESRSFPAAEIWLALGQVHLARADREAARCALERASALAPATPDAHRILAWLTLEDGRAAQAEALCRGALDAFPRDVELMHLLGRALKAQGNVAAARSVLLDAVAMKDEPAILVSLGAVCIDAGLDAEARGYLEQAIARGENTAEAWDNLGLACRRLGDRVAATRAFECAVDRDPQFTPALANLISALRDQCRWDEAGARERQWLEDLDNPAADPRRHPFLALSLATTPEQQKRIAREWSARMVPGTSMPAVVSARGTRLRVGYLSNQFHTHPMMYLTAGLFECHDRSRFEIFAYSYGPDDRSPIRQRVRAAIEHWVEARTLDDDTCARRIREDGIDVLVEMVGHTEGGRLGIVARRPAPVQIHYMGFPGTLGVDGIDAIVADAEIVPEGAERWFHERVLRMPITYMVTDNRRGLLPAPARHEQGLPDDALVLACFNQPYKLTRTYFAIWCEALRGIPSAVLWLYQPALREPAADRRGGRPLRGVGRAHRIRVAGGSGSPYRAAAVGRHRA